MQSPSQIRAMMNRAMQDCDSWVIHLRYRDAKGVVTARCISPIRFVGRNRVLALCLVRQEPRQLHLDRCREVRLGRAADVIMPMPEGEASG